MTTLLTEADPFDVHRTRRASGLLREFNEIGLLAASDVHVAARLAELGGERDESVLLAVALAVRAPRLGHVYVDLATIGQTAAVESEEPVDLSTLGWPVVAEWVARVAGSHLVAVGDDDDQGGAESEGCPLRLVGEWLYLDRYWREERRLAADLLGFALGRPAGVDVALLADGLGRMFAGDPDGRQCLAAATAVVRRLTVVAGGPGTGKTTTVARIVALIAEQAAASGKGAPLVALAAPTGKAAARLEEAVHEEAGRLDVDAAVRAQLLALKASTLHRLLGWRPDSHSRFRHHRGQRLPHELVIVDETSMVSLSLMGRLVEAVRPDARLVVVGDPEQLASIEAGAVLGDIVGPAKDGVARGFDLRLLLASASASSSTSSASASEGRAGRSAIGDGIVVLDRVHRYGGSIARLAGAIRRDDADGVIEELSAGRDDVTWIAVDAAAASDGAELALVRQLTIATARAVTAAADAGAARAAIEALGSFRILGAHRRGPYGVARWTAQIESWLAAAIDGFGDGGRWYPGRPLLITENDYELGLYNGDTGVVVRDAPDRVSVAFTRRGELVRVSPTRLRAVDTVYAMTVHKAQGSQFDTVAVLLPAPSSRLLTRELLYTAATRARARLIVIGTEEAIRQAVGRPIARASGLGWRLWGT